MINMRNLILSVSLVLYSVASFSIRASAVSYILLFAFILSSYKVNRKIFEVNRKLLIFSLLLASYFLCSLFLSDSIRFVYYIKFLLLYPYFFIFSNLILLRKVKFYDLDTVVKYYVLIHSSIFLSQLVAYYAFGHYIDFNNMIREKFANTAYMSRDMNDMFISIRATGLFSEPSFYAMTIFPGLVYIFNRKVFKLSLLVGIATVILSFSAAAFIVLIMWMSVQMLFERGFKFRKFMMLFMIGIVVISMGTFFVKRTTDSNDYDALGARLRIVHELQQRHDINNLIGAGFFLEEFEGNGVTGITSAGIRDSGMLLSTLYSAGIIGLFVILATLALYLNNIKFFVIFMVLISFKYNIILSSFWVLVLLILVPTKLNEYFDD